MKNLSTENGFTPKNLEVLRAQLNEVLSAAGFENLEFDTGRIKYETASCTIPLEIKIKGMKTQTDHMLERHMAGHNLGYDGRSGQKLIGYNSRAHKMPFLYKDIDGKTYKCDSRRAKEIFGK